MEDYIDSDCPASPALFIVWQRARMRALAHYFASERLRKEAQSGYWVEMFISILGFGLLVVGLSISEIGLINTLVSKYGNFVGKELEIWGRIFVICSVIVSVISLFIAIVSVRYDKTILHSRHKLISRQFMSISQKARRPDAGVMTDKECRILIFYLNDFLDTIFTSAENPDDSDYKKAEEIMQKVRESSVPGVSESFVPQSAQDPEGDARIDAAAGGGELEKGASHRRPLPI